MDRRFSLCFQSSRFPFGYPCLTHAQVRPRHCRSRDLAFIWLNYQHMTSAQMVVYVGNSPPTTLFQIGKKYKSPEFLHLPKSPGAGSCFLGPWTQTTSPSACTLAEKSLSLSFRCTTPLGVGLGAKPPKVLTAEANPLSQHLFAELVHPMN